MNTSLPAVTVVGSINLDLIATAERLPTAGETIGRAVLSEQPGGKGANQAAAVARLGGSSRLVGAVGNDASGQRMLDALAAAGVDTADVAVLPEPTGTALIVVDREGENQIVVCPGANSHLSLDGVEFAPGEAVLCQLEVGRCTTITCVQLPGHARPPALGCQGNSMRCIPEDPEFGEGFHAEKAVWEALKSSLPDDCVLAHSVQIREGRSEHEIDLLVLWPNVGMAAIEVKGGQASINDGQWYQSDRSQKRKIKSPVAQSQSSLHALKNWLEDQLGSRISSRSVYMVSLPYTDVPRDWTMAGCPRSLILDQTDSKAPADLVRQAIENEGGGASPLAPAFLERIVRKLGGNLDTAVVPSTTSHEDEAAQDHLTERQSVLLQATRSLPRIRFTGGAGSGKTWLAVEKAKLLSKQGKRVGLFCYNKGLGQYLQDRVATWRQAKPVFTGEFHEYVRGLGVPDGKGQDYFDVEMPRLLKELAADMDPRDRLDAVVVDEAQDFAPLWWDALLACTTDPTAGEVYAFMDDRQDVYQRWGGATADLTNGPMATMVPIHIDDNLRNTRKIAESFRPFAGEHFTPRGSTGLPVRFVDCPTKDALDVAGDCVEALIDEGWANNQIALLTTKDRHPIHLDYFERGATEEYWREFHANEAEFYGHVLGFKGLERSVVVLCVNGFKDMGRAPEQLYVGLSRARSLLVVVGDSGLLEEAGGRELKLALARTQAWKPVLAGG